MNKVQTDNSYLEAKIKLRIENLPSLKSLYVLDAFGGDGLIWNEIRKRTDKNITVLRMDKKRNKKGVYLKGENIKFIKSMNLNQFDCIDLDAYGVPFVHLKHIFNTGYNKPIFVTFIQSVMGRLPQKMLYEIGYTPNMVRKIPSLFCKNGIDKFKNWLAIKGINKIKIISFDRKHYLIINY